MNKTLEKFEESINFNYKSITADEAAELTKNCINLKAGIYGDIIAAANEGKSVIAVYCERITKEVEDAIVSDLNNNGFNVKVSYDNYSKGKYGISKVSSCVSFVISW